MITLATPLGTYLRLCEARGANPDGHCPACAWARGTFDEAVPLARALDALDTAEIGPEAAMFAFEHMLDRLSPAVRERFARIIASEASVVLQALSWSRLVAAHKAGAAAPSEAEDWLLRGAWHSSWRGRSALPGWERNA
jgi:hypothetical protein